MIAGVLVMGTFLCWFFSYDTLGGPLGKYLVSSDTDSFGYVTFRSLQLGRTEQKQPLLVVLGTSIFSNALASERKLEESLKHASGEDWNVALLTTALQSPIDQVTLIQTIIRPTLEQKERIIIIVGVSTFRGEWPKEVLLEIEQNSRLGLRSDWADSEIESIGGEPKPRSSIYIYENWEFFLHHARKTILRFFVQGPATRQFDSFSPLVRAPENFENREELIEKMYEWYDPNDESYLNRFQVLENLLKLHPNVQLVFVQELPSPELLSEDLFGKQVNAERAQYEAFSKKIGADYWPIFEESQISAESYFDYFHIGDPSAQENIRINLVNRVTNSE